jgi:hypothetical protein
VKAKVAPTVRDPGLTELLARQALRYRILRRIYEQSEANTKLNVYPHKLYGGEEIGQLLMDQVLAYLRDAKLITAGQSTINYLTITHKGIVEVESAIRNPTKGTEHFESGVTSAFAKDSCGRTMTMRINN